MSAPRETLFASPSRSAAHLRLVPTPTEREQQEKHVRFVTESLFSFARNVRDFADAYPAQYRDRVDAEGVVLFRRYMDQFGKLARQFEKLADMARQTQSMPINRERLDAEVDAIRHRMVELTLGA